MDDRALDGKPQAEAVASRADGRPPTEASSDAPRRQAQVILEDSEARLAAGAAKAGSGPDGAVPRCGAAFARQDGSEDACALSEGHSGGHSGSSTHVNTGD